MNRKEILESAAGLIAESGGERGMVYGPAKTNHQDIAIGWSTIVNRAGQINESTVCLMMAWLKICRASKSPTHTDSYIDGCGYLALASELAIEEAKDEPK